MKITQNKSIRKLTIVAAFLSVNVSCSQHSNSNSLANQPPEVIIHSEKIVKSVEVFQYPEVPEEAEAYSFPVSHPVGITVELEEGGKYVHTFDEKGRPRSVEFYPANNGEVVIVFLGSSE